MRHEQAYLLAKGRPKPPGQPPVDVIEFPYSGNGLHPTQKPVTALTPLLMAYSEAGEIVLDPFAGSGSTGIAARETSRRFVLIEKDPSYARTAQSRLSGGRPSLSSTPR
jgi:site-specific DNA-methyltransferase (adenine-specific)